MTFQDTRQDLDMFGVPEDLTNGYDDNDSWGIESNTAPKGQPGTAGAVEPHNNDEVRYQYWQSQYDQMKNKYSELENNYKALAEEVQEIRKPAEPVGEEERFPDPPAPPVKPYGFSYQEAMSDPNSESARHMIAMTEYNENMNQYNLYRTQWVEAKHAEEMQKITKMSQAEKAETQRRNEMAQQITGVITSVQQKFGVDYDTALDFVNTMSDNSSITVENLFELYKMQKGVSQGQMPNGRYAPANNPQQQFNPFGASAQPSPDFRQFQRAQSVPPTMGVHNAQASTNVDPFMAMLQQTIKNSNNQNIY